MSSMNWIDRAYIGLLVDDSRLVAGMVAAIDKAMVPVQAEVNRVTREIADDFRDAAQEADQALGKIGGAGLAKVAVEAELVAHEVEDAFKDAADDADHHLGGIGVGLGGAIRGAVAKAMTPDAELVDRFVRPWETGLATPLGLGIAAGIVTVAAPLVISAIGAAALLGLGGAVVGLAAIGLRENEKIHKAFADAGKGVSDMLERIAKPLEGPIVRAIGDLAGAFKDLEGPLSRMVKALAPSIDPFVTGMIALAKGAMPGLESAMPGVAAAFDAISKNLPGLGRSVGAFFKTISDNREALTLTIDLLFDIVNALIVGLGGAIRIAQTGLLFLRDRFNETRAGIKAATTWIEELPGRFRESLTATETRVQGWSDTIRTRFSSALTSIEDRVQSWATTIRSRFSTNLTSVEDRVQSWSTTTRARFASALGAVEDRVQVYSDRVKARFFGNFTDVEGRASTWSTILRATFTNGLNTIESRVASWAADVRERFTTAMQAVENTVSARIRDIVAWFDGLPGRIKGALGSAGTLLTSWGRNVLQGLLDGLKDRWADVQAWFRGIPTWIKEHKGPLSVDRTLLVPAGRAIMDGFLKGLRSGHGPAISFVQGIVGDIWGSVMGAWDAASGVWRKVTDLFGLAGTASATGGAGGPIVSLVRNMAASVGWAGAQWDALYQLIMHESGFRPNAQNPTSTAYGLFQFLDSTWASVGATKTSDPVGQIQAGFRYIASRYGSPAGAWNFWQGHHWYDQGTLLTEPTLMIGRSGRVGIAAERGAERLLGREDTARLGGTTVIVNAHTDANPYQIGREVAWAMLTSGR